MTIDTEKVGQSTAVLTLNGRLDTANAPLLERKIRQWENEITELILDFSGLEYISSMGLRVLLQAKKTLKAENCNLTIKNMRDSIREIFEMTGFLNLMLQEEKFVVIRKLDQDDIALALNGQMHSENVAMISKELSEIKEHESKADKSVTVILDMEKLTYISSGAIKQLKQAIEDSAWNKRNLKIRNASVDIKAALKENSLGEML